MIWHAVQKKIPAISTICRDMVSFETLSGGERGIRTPGPVTVNGFQDRRNRPLCNLSGCKIIALKCNCQKIYENIYVKLQM